MKNLVKRIQFKFAYSNLQHLKQLSRKNTLPYFQIYSQNIKIIQSPLDFYIALNSLALKATKRIALSSLYLGTGNLQRYLLYNLQSNCTRNKNLRLRLLFDYYRSERFQKGSSGTQLLRNMYLETRHNNQHLRFGFFKNNKSKILQQLPFFGGKLAQILGVHHIKLYIFDNDIILTGANLSHSYFTYRQDRYLLLKNCENLADYLYDFVDVMIDGSHRFNQFGTFQTNLNSGFPNYIKLWRFSNREPKLYERISSKQQNQSDTKNQAKQQQISEEEKKQIQVRNINTKEQILEKLNMTHDQYDVGKILAKIQKTQKYQDIISLGQKVYIFPSTQLNILSDCNDLQFMKQILLKNSLNQNILKIASGYMNFSKPIVSILQKVTQKSKILTASPEANSFYEGGLFKKYIPHFYRCYIYNTLKRINQNLIQIKQYKKWGWTFHAKGIWIEQKQTKNFLTIIGSSNYNRRSYERDNEFQFFIYSSCKSLNKRLNREWEQLQKECLTVNIQDLKKDKVNSVNIIKRFWARLFSRFM